MLYDTFMFFNELDLLEIRLHVLCEVVDRFVLVESDTDHRRRPKALHFADNKERFAPFLEKIEHVVVRDMPHGDNNWVRENHQRRAILRGLGRCNDDDVVMLSDLDEIPCPRAITAHRHESDLVFFDQRYHCYFINCQADGSQWPGTALTRYRSFRDPQRIRDRRSRPDRWHERLPGRRSRHIPDAGWHFTFLGGVDAIIQKIESFAHAEFNTPEMKSPERIMARMEQGTDLFLENKDGLKFRFAAIDDSYPAYLRQHADRYPHLVHVPPSQEPRSQA